MIGLANELPVLVLEDPEDGSIPLLRAIKGAVALEWQPDGVMAVLVNTGTRFQWLDVTECLPAESSEEYRTQSLSPVRELQPKRV